MSWEIWAIIECIASDGHVRDLNIGRVVGDLIDLMDGRVVNRRSLSRVVKHVASLHL